MENKESGEIGISSVWFENGKWMADDDGSVFEFDTEEEALEFLDRSGSVTLFSDEW